MPDLRWAAAINNLEPYIFRISTPRGFGTGFLISRSGNICGIATALHVIEHADDWEEPIKIIHYTTNKQVILRKEDRVIFTYPKEDLSFLLLQQKDLELPDKMIEMIEPDKHIRQGIQMGWCGFPGIAPDGTLCFFTGHVSAFLEDTGSYLLDGVAINGVSGGPAFTVRDNVPRLCGVVSAYIANRVTGETLPGVCLIRDVAPYQDALSKLSSLEKARAEAKAEESAGAGDKKVKPPIKKKVPKKPIRKPKKRE